MNIFFESIGAFFKNLVVRFGVVGLAFGMFAESLGVPGAAVVLPLSAGPLIISGGTSFLVVLFFATLGLTLGSVISYYMGYYGADLGKKVVKSKPEQSKKEQSKATVFIKKYGDLGILFAQLFGPARTWISLPAGAMKLDIKKFIIYTAIGGTIYCSAVIGLSLVIASVLKGLYHRIQEIIGPYMGVLTIALIVGVIILIYLATIKALQKNEETVSAKD